MPILNMECSNVVDREEHLRLRVPGGHDGKESLVRVRPAISVEMTSCWWDVFRRDEESVISSLDFFLGQIKYLYL